MSMPEFSRPNTGVLLQPTESKLGCTVRGNVQKGKAQKAEDGLESGQILPDLHRGGNFGLSLKFRIS